MSLPPALVLCTPLVGVLALVAFLWLGKRRQRRFDLAASEASRRLVGLRFRDPILYVQALYWYGAVDISARHGILWVLIAGPGSENLPPWLHLDREGRPDAPPLDPALRAWLAELESAVQQTFRDCGWRSRRPCVGFESIERVDRTGGYFYFK